MMFRLIAIRMETGMITFMTNSHMVNIVMYDSSDKMTQMLIILALDVILISIALTDIHKEMKIEALIAKQRASNKKG